MYLVQIVNFGSNNVTLRISLDGLDKNPIDAAGSTMTLLTSSTKMDENSFNAPNKVSYNVNRL